MGAEIVIVVLTVEVKDITLTAESVGGWDSCS